MSRFTRTPKLSSWIVLPVGILVLVLGLVAGALQSSAAPATPLQGGVFAQDPEEDEAVLPSRVSNAIDRGMNAFEGVETAVDNNQFDVAQSALAALTENFGRAQRAALTQINAEPVDPEAETTPGPDSAVAVLNFDQTVITRLAGLFDTLDNSQVVTEMEAALTAAYDTRDQILDTVIALDPEGAGAAYADGMADTVDGYADEVANIAEALAVDTLSDPARAALTNAQTRSTATQEKVNTAFGGGEE